MLPFVPAFGCCRRCGRDVAQLSGEFLCEECRETRPAFDRAASVLRFVDEAREIVNAFKFRFHYWLCADFADWLEAVTRARFVVNRIDAIVPVPITLWRRLDRGYNQCDCLARALAKRLGKPLAARALRRKGNPARQGGLNEQERRQNVVGTFAVRRPEDVRGKTVLLVDDIMTTGSTLSACAAELKAAGAEKVWCVTLARSFRT